MKTTLNFQFSIFNCLLLVRAGLKPAPYCLLLLLLATAPAFAQMTVCANQGFMITSKVDAAAISGGVTYTWYVSKDNGASSSITDSNTASLSMPLGKAAAGTYAYVRWVASDACPDGVPSNTYTVVVVPKPTTPTINVSAATVCQPGALTFWVTNPAASNATYTWTASAGGTPDGSSYTFNTAEAGAKTATVNVQVNDGGTVCQSANASTVTAYTAATPSITRSGGNASQYVIQNASQNMAITAITYTASNASSIVPGGSLPSGVTGSAGDLVYTISGAPTSAGTFGYTLTTANSNGCTNDTASGTITVAMTSSTGGPNTAYSSAIWIFG